MPTIEKLCDTYTVNRSVGKTQRICLDHLIRELGKLEPGQLTDHALLQYRKTRAVSDSTLRRELNTLIAVLNHARRKKLLTLDELPHIDLPAESQPRDAYLSRAQAQDFFDLALDDSTGKPRLTRVTRFVALALWTGARSQAIHDLTWDRVDLDQKMIDFRVPGRPLYKKRRVPVPMHDKLLPILQRAKLERKDPFVIGQGSIRKAYSTWLPVQYQWVTPHILRHTFATLLLQKGASIWQVAGLLGDTPETVTRVYGHHSSEDLKRAMSAL